jgi:hypothetical protein
MNSWFLNRLSTMSPTELFYRLRQKSRSVFEEKFVKQVKFPKLWISSVNVLNIGDTTSYKCDYKMHLFGNELSYKDPEKIEWHKDFLSGKSYPLTFSKKLNIRNQPDLSAKNVWEINRLQFLTGLCLNYRNYRNESDLDLFMQINKSWFEHNPYLKGINWYSNIEVNLRLINWSLCWEILDAEKLRVEHPTFSEFVNFVWIPGIYIHCHYSYANPSLYSSSNNHLISEYAGLFIAASIWQFPESLRWIRYSKAGLEQEISRQNSNNGINKEEAAEYIQFITDFFLLAFIVGESTQRKFSPNYRKYLHSIFSYIRDFLDVKGNYPRYGDEDDGKCFILSENHHFNNFTSLLTSGAIIFNNSSFKSASAGFDLKNQILFGSKGKKALDEITYEEIIPASKFFKKEGHFIFRKRIGKQETYLHLDAAPLGFLSIAAHGHADALSFRLHIDGKEVFIDSGTYTYHTEPEWRQYFIGTLAHNTVRINGLNQAISAGPTLWTKHYRTKILECNQTNEIESVVATHDGYRKEKIQHIREIKFNRLLNEFTIFDAFNKSGDESTIIEIPFHVHPDTKIIQTEGTRFLLMSPQHRNVDIEIDEQLKPIVVNGQTEPEILGWFSASFQHKIPTQVIYCKTVLKASCSFRYRIKIK